MSELRNACGRHGRSCEGGARLLPRFTSSRSCKVQFLAPDTKHCGLVVGCQNSQELLVSFVDL